MRMRPAGFDDVAELLALFRRSELVEVGREESTAADIRSLLGAPSLDLTHRSRVLAESGGQLAGFLALHPAPQPGLLRAQLAVNPDRAVELAETLLAQLGEWAGMEQQPADVSLFQLPDALVTKPLTEHGWRIVHSYTRLIIDLTAPATPFTQKPGIRIRIAESEADRRLAHAILEDATAQDWNHRRREFADFEADQRSRDGYDPRLWWLAELDGQPAGLLIGRDPERRSWIAWLGVLAQARGRGLAQALLHTAFDEFRARGRDRVGVDTDMHNATDAVKVYERAGMVVLGTADQWHRVYSGPAAGNILCR